MKCVQYAVKETASVSDTCMEKKYFYKKSPTRYVIQRETEREMEWKNYFYIGLNWFLFIPFINWIPRIRHDMAC